ncbi:MAG TPA: histidine kinase, partial [Anaerolineales bacterium]|nr:histidine kinase [Anaerolineales bacterium]
METSSTLTVQQEQQEKSLLLFVVVVGYIITFVVAANGGTRYSIQQLLVGIGCGVIYLIFGFFEKEIFQRFLPNTRITIFFPIQLALALSIGWTLGPGGNWLISLPLAAMAAERLSSRSRWFVYVGLLIAIILPIAHYSTWHDALINTLVISTAIFFIDLVTRFRLNERQARAKAENLALQLEGANRRLAEYASQAEELAVTQERNRLAHEIHDNLGHYLTIANVQIEAARATLHSDPGRAQAALEKAHGLVKKGLMSVRESVSALRTSPVENRSLEDVFIALIGETQASG